MSFNVEQNRLQAIRDTAESLASAILQAESHERSLRETEWKNYVGGLDSAVKGIAIQAFKNKLWGLDNAEG
jgi:hypothetical protein